MFNVFLAGDVELAGIEPAHLSAWKENGFALGGMEKDSRTALEAIQATRPDLLVVGFAGTMPADFSLYEEAVSMAPWMGVVVVLSKQAALHDWRDRVLGVGECLAGPLTADQLIKALKRVSARVEAAGIHWLWRYISRSSLSPEAAGEITSSEKEPPGAIHGLLSQVCDPTNPSRTFKSIRDDSTVWKAQQYIMANFADPALTLRQVADHVSLSNNHFCTIFSQKMGMTFTEYLTSLRMNKARELLTGTNMKTIEVAAQVGYNDPHYFSYLFKKQTGVTPRDFRREAQKEKDD